MLWLARIRVSRDSAWYPARSAMHRFIAPVGRVRAGRRCENPDCGDSERGDSERGHLKRRLGKTLGERRHGKSLHSEWSFSETERRLGEATRRGDSERRLGARGLSYLSISPFFLPPSLPPLFLALSLPLFHRPSRPPSLPLTRSSLCSVISTVSGLQF